MDYYVYLYRHYTDDFWQVFATFTGWDPAPETQPKILGGFLIFLFLIGYSGYLRSISRRKLRHKKLIGQVTTYQRQRRDQVI